MNFNSSFKHIGKTPLPDRDRFYSSLKNRLFPESAHHKSWRMWVAFPSTAVALLTLVLFITSTFQTSTVALADAIANTIQFTQSDQFVRQTVTIDKIAGVGVAPTDMVMINENGEEVSPYPQEYSETNTWWLYQGNARIDTIRTTDGVTNKISSLISAYDQTQCSFDDMQSEQGSCSDDASEPVNSYMDASLTIPSYLKPFENDGNLNISNISVKPYKDPEGDTWDILVTFETDAPMQQPMAILSTGPSGYGEYGYPGRSWVDENGKFQNEIIYIYSEDLRFNASNAFYPDDNGKCYMQIMESMDNTKKSNIYLLNIDDYTITPASDEELKQSQETYQELAGQFGVSIERMERDYELIFGNVTYLQDHITDLKELDKETDGNIAILSYSVPADLGLYGGTNNALITKASFTIDQNTKSIVEYGFYDAEGTEVEHAEIEKSTPSVDPQSIFTKESWLSSL